MSDTSGSHSTSSPLRYSLRDSTVLQQVLILAVPAFIDQFLRMMVGFSDTLLAGQYLTEAHLAAIIMADYLVWFLTGLFVMVSTGSTAMVARFSGSNQWTQAQWVTNQSLTLALALSLSITTVGLLVIDPCVSALNLQEDAQPFAVEYLTWLLPVMPLAMIEIIGIACLRGAGDTRSGMWIMVGVNIINISTSWSLVLGLGPFPALGWTGIAIGTSISHAWGGLVCGALLIRGRAGLKFNPAQLIPHWSLIRRILRISLPAGGDLVTVILCHLVYMSLINSLGTYATAAHGIALRAESMAFLSAVAFSVAATTLCGQHLGAKSPQKAVQATWTAYAMGTSLMVVIGGFFWMFPYQIVSLFVHENNQHVARLAAPLLRLVAWCMPFLGTTIILTGSLRGAGDTRWPWLFTLVGHLGIRLPLAFAFTQIWEGGLYGAWVAMFLDIFLRSFMVLARFLHGGWKNTRI